MTPILLRTYFLNVKHLKMPQMKLKCFLDEKTQELEGIFFSLSLQTPLSNPQNGLCMQHPNKPELN